MQLSNNIWEIITYDEVGELTKPFPPLLIIT